MKNYDDEEYDILETIPSTKITTPLIGRIVGTNRYKDILVQFASHKPKPAKIVSGLYRRELIKEEYKGRNVLLLFEKGDPDLPIILNLMEDPLEKLMSLELSEEEKKPKEVMIDGKKILFEAEEEIIMKCGQGQIILRNDGKIILKGTNITSRAKNMNKVKGGAVHIN